MCTSHREPLGRYGGLGVPRLSGGEGNDGLALIDSGVDGHGTLESWSTDERAPAQRMAESVTELGIHPEVNDWIVAAVAHCQPVTGDPDCLDVRELPDGGVGVADQCYAVKWKPAQSVYDHHRYHHLYHLKQPKKHHPIILDLLTIWSLLF